MNKKNVKSKDDSKDSKSSSKDVSKDSKDDNKDLKSSSKDVLKNDVPALEVINFTKHYRGRPLPAVSNLSFKVYPGEFHGFIGANGAGKTTSIKSIIGAYAKFKGEVKIFGIQNSKIDAKKELGYIPEAANFPKKFSTLQYIKYMSYLSGLSKKDAKKYAINKLKELGLESVMKKSPNSFSSGQKKKVLLAQALVHNPKILIMDEPAANLDPQARFEFFDNLKELQQQKKAIFISSHILAELDKFVDSVTIVDGGKIVYTGSVAELTRNEEMVYRIQTENAEITKEYLESKNIEFSIDQKSKINVILAKMLNRENIFDFQKFVVENNIILDEFKNNVVSLEEVYEHFVRYGSIDTPNSKVEKRSQKNA